MKKITLAFNSVFFLTLLACAPSSSSVSEGTPVYQGMTISNAQINTNRNAKRFETSEDNPFDLEENKRLEKRIEDDLLVGISDPNFDYYARANELVRITINISNPLSFVILSFNLNGRRYQSYEFREGSDSQRLLMDVELRSEFGLQSLTLDEIKYVDGTQIKDVILAGEKTLSIAIENTELPQVEILQETISPTSLSLQIRTTDANNLIQENPKHMYVYLFDGMTLQKAELTLGVKTITFSNLKSKSLYQYSIATSLFLYAAQGTTVFFFQTDNFYTDPFLTLNLDIAKTSISYEVQLDDNQAIGAFDGIVLKSNNEIVEIKQSLIGIFENLLTNAIYEIEVSYVYPPEVELLTTTVQTLANQAPEFAFTSINPGKKNITFDIFFNDPDQVGQINQIEILHLGETIETLENLTNLSFSNLLTGTEYELKSTISYNLQDGEGTKFFEIRESFTTGFALEPVLKVQSISFLEGQLLLNTFIEDDDFTLISRGTITLRENGVKVSEKAYLEQLVFENLQSEAVYDVTFEFTYDLMDGLGLREKSVFIDKNLNNVISYGFTQSSMSQWTVWTPDTMTIINGQLAYSYENTPNKNSWDSILQLNSFIANPGKSYRITFKASDLNVANLYFVLWSPTNPNDLYFIQLQVTPTLQEFVVDYTRSQDAGVVNFQIHFALGENIYDNSIFTLSEFSIDEVTPISFRN